MVEAAKDKAYIKYNDYSSYKTRFSRVEESSIDLIKLEELINKSTENSNIRNKFTKVFKELYRHLKHDGIFYEYSPKACYYISYILHNVVDKEIKELYSRDLYKILYKFVIQFNQDRSSRNNTCINELVYIDDNLFKEMNALYRVYDEYYNFIERKDYTYYETCDKLQNLVNIYKDYINGHESKSKNFNNILTHLEKSFKETLEKNHTQCKSKDTLLPKLQLYTPPEKKQPKVQKTEETPHSSTSVLTVSQELQQGLPEHTVSQTYSEKAQIVLPQEDSESVVNHGRVEETQIQQQTRSTEETGEIEKTRDVEGQRTNRYSLSTQSPVQYRFSETLESPGKLAFIGSSEYLRSPETQSEAGILDQMRYTISNVLGSVEPGPVLGVSGGMGALFLLFKYTPVGSFFGGRRRRIHQIPSSFRGFPAGEFPIFHEYEGGNIGYGPMNPLAE